MRTIRTFVVAAFLPMTACGTDNAPPESCVELVGQEVFVGESKVVPVCFQDADGDELTVTVEVSDPEVVEAVVQGRTRAILLNGIAVGEVIVTVVATDTGGQMAEVFFSVSVPNRAPEIRAELPGITLTDETPEIEVELLDYFEDPDEQELSFTADVDDPSVASASVAGSVLTLAKVGSGSTVIQVTAMDPHGGSVAQTAGVTLRVEVQLFRDDFTVFSGWEQGTAADASIVDGRLRIGITDFDFFAVVERGVNRGMNWKVTSNLEHRSDDYWPSVAVVFPPNSNPVALFVIFGGDAQRIVTNTESPKTNLMVVALRPDGNLTTALPWIGTSPAVKAPGERMDVGVSATASGITILVDGEEALAFSRTAHPDFELPVEIAGLGLVGLTPPGIESLEDGDAVFFDWVEVRGVEPTESIQAMEAFRRLPLALRRLEVRLRR